MKTPPGLPKDVDTAVKKRLHVSMKRGLPVLLIAQTVVLMICAIFVLRIFYDNYTDHYYMQVMEALDLYVLNCENKLDIVEKWSYSILSDENIQSAMQTVNDGTLDEYDAYIAKQTVKRQLTNYLFTIDNAASIDFISNDGSQLVSSYTTQNGAFSEEEVERFRALAEPLQGGVTWTRGTDRDSLILLRTIRDIQHTQFPDLGILTIDCPMTDIFLSELPDRFGYSPLIVIADENGGFYSSQGTDEQALINNQITDSEQNLFVQVDGQRFFYASTSSSRTGWAYTCYISAADMMRDVDQLRNDLLTVIIAVSAATLLVTLLFSMNATRQIGRLTDQMEAVRGGEYRLSPPQYGLFQMQEVEQLGNSFHYMTNEIDHLINDVFRKQITIQDMRYRILQSQINPHFLYNTLETVNSLAKAADQSQISLVVCMLSRILRTSISGQDPHTLRAELEMLQQYVTIQKVRFEERLQFSLSVPEEVMDTLIPKLTLQTLVENSINYALERYARVCEISVWAELRDGDVYLTLSDNGPGMEAAFVERIFSGEIVPTNTGLGIKNVHERIVILFGAEYGLRFESKVGAGTAAILHLPYCTHLPDTQQEES